MINYNYYDITNVSMGELLDWLSDFKGGLISDILLLIIDIVIYLHIMIIIL